jgi:hypothetical protein
MTYHDKQVEINSLPIFSPITGFCYVYKALPLFYILIVLFRLILAYLLIRS